MIGGKPEVFSVTIRTHYDEKLCYEPPKPQQVPSMTIAGKASLTHSAYRVEVLEHANSVRWTLAAIHQPWRPHSTNFLYV